MRSQSSCLSELQIFKPNNWSLMNRDRPKPPLIFNIRSAYLRLSLQRNQLHLKEYFYLLPLFQFQTAKLTICFIIFKKWIVFCLQFEALLRHFFLFLWQLNLLQSEELAQLRQDLRLSIYLLTLIQRKIEQILCQEREF